MMIAKIIKNNSEILCREKIRSDVHLLLSLGTKQFLDLIFTKKTWAHR